MDPRGPRAVVRRRPVQAARPSDTEQVVDALARLIADVSLTQRRVPGTRTEGSSQVMRLASAVQRPTDGRDDVTPLLLPEANTAYCPVEPSASAIGVDLLSDPRGGGSIYGDLLGAGVNARVHALARPARAIETGQHLVVCIHGGLQGGGLQGWLMPFDQGCSELQHSSTMDLAGFHLKKS